MVDSGTVLTGVFYLFFIGFIIFQRLGGYPEAWYRIRRIPYFVDYIRGPDKKYRRHSEPMAEMDTTGGIARWTLGKGQYHLPDSEASLSNNGAPMWFHQWDDARAVPQYMDTIVGADGRASLQFRPKIPPSLFAAGMKSKVAIDLHRDEKEPQKTEGFKWITVTLLVIGIVIMIGVLYFEYSNHCGISPKSC
jgi:hypothetical protein